MKLYYSPGACSLSPHIVAEEAGIPLELVQVDLKTHTTAEGDYRRVNPKGYVPALQLDDGRVLTEGPAVAQYLADLAPDTKLAPDPTSFERYRLQEWLIFIGSELHKNFRPLVRGAPQPTMDEARQRIFDRLAHIEKGLTSDYLMGDTLTVADAYLFVILTWVRRLQLDMSGNPRLLAYYDRVLSRPKVQAAMRAEGLKFSTPAQP